MEYPEQRSMREAAERGDTQTLEHLHARDPNILTNSITPQGHTACHIAIIKGHPRFAVRAGELDPRILMASNEDGNTPLHLALASNKETAMLEALINHCCQYARSLTEDVRAVLLSDWNRVLVNNRGESLLYLAAFRGDLRVTKLLIDTQFLGSNDSGPNEVTALHVLVSKMAAPHTRKKSAEYQGIIKHMAKMSLRSKNKNGDTVLHHAVYSCNDCSTIHRMLMADASAATIPNNAGVSPIHLAAKLGRKELIHPFVHESPNACLLTTTEGQNVLHIAMERKDNNLAHEILTQNDETDAVLSYSVDNRHFKLLSQQDKNGNTPLHIAATMKNYDEFKEALEKWGHLLFLIRNNEGQTIVDLANAHESTWQRNRRERWIAGADGMKNTLLVVANLITTVTFTVAFTLPGGYNDNDPQKGMAALAGRGGFRLFLVANTLSLCSSVWATIALITAGVVRHLKDKLKVITVAILMLSVSLSTLLVAFVSGVWLAVGHSYRGVLSFIVFTVCVCLLVPIAGLYMEARSWVVRNIKKVIRLGEGQLTWVEHILIRLFSLLGSKKREDESPA